MSSSGGRSGRDRRIGGGGGEPAGHAGVRPPRCRRRGGARVQLGGGVTQDRNDQEHDEPHEPRPAPPPQPRHLMRPSAPLAGRGRCAALRSGAATMRRRCGRVAPGPMDRDTGTRPASAGTAPRSWARTPRACAPGAAPPWWSLVSSRPTKAWANRAPTPSDSTSWGTWEEANTAVFRLRAAGQPLEEAAARRPPGEEVDLVEVKLASPVGGSRVDEPGGVEDGQREHGLGDPLAQRVVGRGRALGRQLDPRW